MTKTVRIQTDFVAEKFTPTRLPNGSKTQRAKRHLAESRQRAFTRWRRARRQADDVVRTRGLIDWAKEIGLNIVVKVVAWKIERDTFRLNINQLEGLKMGVDQWLRTMKAL